MKLVGFRLRAPSNGFIQSDVVLKALRNQGFFIIYCLSSSYLVYLSPVVLGTEVGEYVHRAKTHTLKTQK